MIWGLFERESHAQSMVIGISLLSSMMTSSLSYLDAAPELMYCIKWTKRVAKYGLKLNSLIAP